MIRILAVISGTVSFSISVCILWVMLSFLIGEADSWGEVIVGFIFFLVPLVVFGSLSLWMFSVVLEDDAEAEEPSSLYTVRVRIGDDPPFTATRVLAPDGETNNWWIIEKENGERIHVTGNVQVRSWNESM